MFTNPIYDEPGAKRQKLKPWLIMLLTACIGLSTLNQSLAANSAVIGGGGGWGFTSAGKTPLTSIKLRAGWWLDAIQGVNATGSLPYRGGFGGNAITVTWPAGEYLVRAYGRHGSYIGQISFVTNTGKVLGPYGSALGAGTGRGTFDFSAPAGNAITGFTGKSGLFIDSLGIVYEPVAAEAPSILPMSLKGVKAPSVPGLTDYDSSRKDIIMPIVKNKTMAIALGKALFWDQQVGSDGQACASCHFHAGADSRLKNQVNPGLTRITSPDSKGSWYLSSDPNAATSSFTFQPTKSGGNKSGPNYTLKKADFPFDPANDDVASSQGTFDGQFHKVGDGLADECARSPDVVFNVNGVGVRKVPPRNTPTTINAAFNHRNFWDGRANNVFNGESPFGLRDKAAGVFFAKDGKFSKKPINLINSSLASQAVGPVLSNFEMTCSNRQFADVGRKLLTKTPLAFQKIDPSDSVLGSLASYGNVKYADIIKLAFNDNYFNVKCETSGACGKPASPAGSPNYTQMEANFPMFWGIAIQLYEETLVSDDSKFDRWKAGTASLTPEEKAGYDLFIGKGECSDCHTGPAFTTAAIETNRKFDSRIQVIERMNMLNGPTAVYDEGFYNLGVVPTEYDIGLGAPDPWGNPLSFAKQYVTQKFVDKFSVDACKFEVPFAPDCAKSSNWGSERAAVDGSFKVPTLRNISLTGPYMHNGSLSTLEQVVAFYNRGGNFNNFDKSPEIKPLGLSATEQSYIVAFMKTLTDDRVAYEKAPFDHPSIQLPYGHPGDQNSVTAGNPLEPKLAKDDYVELPAVGKSGRSSAIPTFEDVLNGASLTSPQARTKCADENKSCVLPAGKSYTVYYGSGTKWASKSNMSGTVACNNATFGDPIPGTVKMCNY